MTFWDYLIHIPLETKVIIILIALFLVYKGIAVIPWISWPKEKTQKTHKGCALEHDYRQMLINAKEVAIAPVKLVRAQMTVADDVVFTIRHMLYAQFLKLKKEENEGETTGITFDVETHAYSVALDYSLFIVKQKVRFFFQENHLAEMDEIAFNIKMKERTSQIISLFTETLNGTYPRTIRISREQVYDANQALVPEVERLIYDLFLKARALAVENKEYILSLDAQ